MAYHLDKEKEPTEEAKKEARIAIETIEKTTKEAAKMNPSDIADENSGLKEAYKTAKQLLGKNFQSMFVEPVDEYTSQLFVVDEKGYRKNLGTIPTQKGLNMGMDNYTKKLLKEVANRVEEREEWELDFEKTIAEKFETLDKTSLNMTKEMAEKLQKLNIGAPLEALKFQVDNYFKNFSTAFEALTEYVKSHPVFTLFLEELNALAEDPEYKGADLDRPSLDYVDEKETIEADTLHNKAIHLAMERAKARLLEQEKQEKQETQEKQDNKYAPVIRVERKNSPTTIIPVDKVNSAVWKMLARATPSGQYEFDFVTGKPIKKGQTVIEPLVMYSLDFNKLEETAPETAAIVKHLTPFDKRVMVAVAALYNAGNTYFTITDIWHKMGNAQDKRPAKLDFEKINNSLKKQSYAHLILNNMGEQKADYNYPKYHYEGELLQFEKVTAEIDGQPIESAIHLFREPPLITFARDRKQITTVKNAVLESPVSKTEQNLQIDDYLIERIAAMKRDPKSSRKILYKSLFDDCGINRNQNRAKETIGRYLKHYKATDYIKDFQAQEDCIIITP